MRKKRKSKWIFVISILLMGCISGCAGKEKRNQEKAGRVAAMIDEIYVQQRTENTDQQCEAAKKAWDALSDSQKALVYGEKADPDYFLRDTGDASNDDTLNQDEIGENEILVVSFGTSFNDSRVQDISGIEKTLQSAYPDWSVRRAFTSQIIINHIQARDGAKIDNMDQALERALQNGVKRLVIQPTHLMHGAEYDELVETVDSYREHFEQVAIAEPLLGEVGNDATMINADKEATARAVVEDAVKVSGYHSTEEAAKAGVAYVLLGHGTSHTAKVTYSQMQTQMEKLGNTNVFIGTVEGEPEGTACEDIIENVINAGYNKVVLRPLMVVAGDHANNDMAGDADDSWKSMFEASDSFGEIETQIIGLGRLEAIQEIYIKHTADAIGKSGEGTLENGIYQAEFHTDSKMFHVNETKDGKGVLTVKNGKMTIHVTLPTKNITNLYRGSAKDAAKAEAVLIQPTVDSVTYSDGITEEVYGFDIPVPYLDKEFDVALIGTKGKWYDHKVFVSNPQKRMEEVAKQAADLPDDTYTADITMNGGTGKSTIQSPVVITVKDGLIYAELIWSSKNYDYMIVDGEKYENEAGEDENSRFTIPIKGFGVDISVLADTIAMSTPHEIAYTIQLERPDDAKEEAQGKKSSSLETSIEWKDMKWEKEIDLSYATQFAVEKCDSYELITIVNGGRFLLLEKEKKVPLHIPDDVTVLRKPFQNVYLAASSTFDFIRELDRMECIHFSGIKREDLVIIDVSQAMEKGKMIYAGKYNAPDFELLVNGKCDLAIESTMIYHNPDIREQLENLDIPVLVERSSYETHPFGRLEWVKLYGVLFGEKEKAEQFFEEQIQKAASVAHQKNTGKTVAFFYINSNGIINVRKPKDYIPKLIAMAGGVYALDDKNNADDNALSSMNLQMEDFYLQAKDADILIYNSTIMGEMKSCSELLDMNPLFRDFRAVKNGNVYCTDKNFFQETTGMVYLLQDFNNLLRKENQTEFHYLRKLDKE